MTIEWNKVTWYSKLAAVIVFLLVLVLGFYIGLQYEKLQITKNYSQIEASENEGVDYKNSQYGFELDLPASWKGYTVTTAPFTSFDKTVTYGQTITLRSLNWTEQNPTMDIPIEVFPIEQWQKWTATDFDGYPTAAPIGPSERGRNSKYVFATAPRYNYSFLPGFEEVENIIKNLKTF